MSYYCFECVVNWSPYQAKDGCCPRGGGTRRDVHEPPDDNARELPKAALAAQDKREAREKCEALCALRESEAAALAFELCVSQYRPPHRLGYRPGVDAGKRRVGCARTARVAPSVIRFASERPRAVVAGRPTRVCASSVCDQRGCRSTRLIGSRCLPFSGRAGSRSGRAAGRRPEDEVRER